MDAADDIAGDIADDIVECCCKVFGKDCCCFYLCHEICCGDGSICYKMGLCILLVIQIVILVGFIVFGFWKALN